MIYFRSLPEFQSSPLRRQFVQKGMGMLYFNPRQDAVSIAYNLGQSLHISILAAEAALFGGLSIRCVSILGLGRGHEPGKILRQVSILAEAMRVR